MLFLLIVGQILIGVQVSTTCNLILTVIFLRLFHHGPSPVRRKLRHIVFNIVAPTICFNMKTVGNMSLVLPSKLSIKDNGQENVESDSAANKKEENSKSRPDMYNTSKQQDKNEVYMKEWKAIAKVLDRLLFILNVLMIVTAFGYGYIRLCTH